VIVVQIDNRTVSVIAMPKQPRIFGNPDDIGAILSFPTTNLEMMNARRLIEWFLQIPLTMMFTGPDEGGL
jgi:hypothetical protein